LVDSWTKFFVGKEPEPEEVCPSWVGWSQGARSGLQMGIGEVGGWLQVGGQWWLNWEDGC